MAIEEKHDDDILDDQHYLYELCVDFIEGLNITCAETIYQSDRVIEKAYEFIENICDTIGYDKIDEG